jgi:hypothetical protein
MLFQGRFERARSLQRRLRGLPEDGTEAVNEEDRSGEMPIEKPSIREELEKGDLFAMILAGILSVFLPAAAILAAMIGVCYLLFFH